MRSGSVHRAAGRPHRSRIADHLGAKALQRAGRRRKLDPLNVGADNRQAVEEHLEVDLDEAAAGFDSKLLDLPDLDASESNRTRDLEAADVAPGVGDG